MRSVTVKAQVTRKGAHAHPPWPASFAAGTTDGPGALNSQQARLTATRQFALEMAYRKSCYVQPKFRSLSHQATASLPTYYADIPADQQFSCF
jgi:hypothetical protein